MWIINSKPLEIFGNACTFINKEGAMEEVIEKDRFETTAEFWLFEYERGG